jgi:hypothetical protein
MLIYICVFNVQQKSNTLLTNLKTKQEQNKKDPES